jgi:hypothetical protein
MAKRYLGHKPKTDDWDFLGPIEADGKWLVYIRPDQESEWSSVKVVADGRAVGKANYWLGWNGHRFSRQSDLPLLLLRSSLAKAVEDMLVGLQEVEGLDLL